MPLVVLFDVNETLLDLAALDPLFDELFGDTGSRREWFAGTLHTALALTASRRYEDFSGIAVGALRALGAQRKVGIDATTAKRVTDGLRSLPAHADVVPALETLARAGARLATLTNSPRAVVEAQLASAGIAGHFTVVVSCDEVRMLKPAPEPYLHAADILGVPIEEVTLVAAHGWDVAGALAAGARAAFVARPGQQLLAVGPTPEVIGNDLVDVARTLIQGADLRG